MLIYVDDIIVANSSSQDVNTLLAQLRQDFAIKDLGEIHYFLGIHVANTADGIVLSQSKYIGKILDRTNMQNCKPISTPMSVSEKLSKAIGTPLSAEGITQYRSTVGGLQYVTITRPNVSFAVNRVC